MGFLFLTNKKTKEAEMLRQSPVQCNEDCELTLPDQDVLKVRLRDLYWNGFTIDQIPKDLWDNRDKEKTFRVSFVVPRQFGAIDFDLMKVKAKGYVDLISDKDMYAIEVNLDDHPSLQNIRDFLVYRNKSFIRRSKRRLKKTLTEKSLLIFWVFISLFSFICWFCAY